MGPDGDLFLVAPDERARNSRSNRGVWRFRTPPAGFASLLPMTPLASTSTNKMARRLGAVRWAVLHRLVYALLQHPPDSPDDPALATVRAA